jgi:alpha-mannosidase
LSQWLVNGQEVAPAGAGKALVLRDNEDPWGMTVHRFREVEGSFSLLDPSAAAIFAGVRAAELPAVRVIEDGPVRTVVEALFGWKLSRLQLRWLLPKQGTEIGLEVRVLWQEKDRMLKLAIPTGMIGGTLQGQVAYGSDALPSDGREAVAQQWVAATSGTRAVTAINDGTYGCDFAAEDGELRLTLLRSPAYSAHPINERPLVPQDRFTPRIDQGERRFRFWFDSSLVAIDRRALVHNRQPFALSFFPAGGGTAVKPGFTLSDEVCLLTACKRAEGGTDLIVRLFNPTPERRRTTLKLAVRKLSEPVVLGPFEIVTLRLTRTGKVVRCDLLERPLKV